MVCRVHDAPRRLLALDVADGVLPEVGHLLRSGNLTRRRVAGVVYMHADAFITCELIRIMHAQPRCILRAPRWSHPTPMASVLEPATRARLNSAWLNWTTSYLQRASWAHDVVMGGADVWVVPTAHLARFNEMAVSLGGQFVINEIAVPTIFERLQRAHAACTLCLSCTGGPMKHVHAAADSACGHKVDLLDENETHALEKLYRAHARCWAAQPRQLDFWAHAVSAQETSGHAP